MAQTDEITKEDLFSVKIIHINGGSPHFNIYMGSPLHCIWESEIIDAKNLDSFDRALADLKENLEDALQRFREEEFFPENLLWELPTEDVTALKP